MTAVDLSAREAERNVLGAMMLNVAATWEIVDTVTAEDFNEPRHGDLYRVIGRLAAAGGPVDPIAVVDAATVEGILEGIGGAAYVFELHGLPGTWTNISYYGGIVVQAAVRRRLALAGELIADLGNSGAGDAFEQVEAARDCLAGVGVRSRLDIKPVGATFDALIDSLSEPPRYVPSPWKELNTLIGGFRPGGLYIVGARPGDGKTIMGLQIAGALARTGNVVYATLEMSEAELQKRLLAQYGSISMGALVNSKLTEKDWGRLEHARTMLDGMPLYIDDRAGSNISQIKAYVRATARKGTLAGVVVDYLQLIVSKPGDQRPRHEIVAEISRELKELARDLGVPVVALSQLNNRDGSKAGMGNLRESGAIEQDADVVILISRDKEDPDRQHILEVSVPKNRHGASGSLELMWEGYFSRVADMNTLYGNPGQEGRD